MITARAEPLLHLDIDLLRLVGALDLQAPALQQRTQVLGFLDPVPLGWLATKLLG